MPLSTSRPTSDTPLSCYFENEFYSNGERISVRNPCVHCFCHRGKPTCYRQNCPPPPVGCKLIDSSDSCQNSIYNCCKFLLNSSLICKLLLNISCHLAIPEKHQKPLLRKEATIYGQRKRGSGLVKADCIIRGIAYFVGETVGVASSDCLRCQCARTSLLCTPLCCYEPIVPSARSLNSFKSLYPQAFYSRDPHPLHHLN